MSFQWKLVAGFLYFEIALIFFLLLPLISPRKWQKFFRIGPIQLIAHRSTIYFYIVLVILSLFLVDSVRDMRKHSSSLNNPMEDGNLAHEMKNSIKVFRAQRNFYITFFAIFLFYVLRRVITMIDTQASLLDKSEAIIKGAEESTGLACKTIRDHENFILLEKDKHENIVNVLQDQIHNLEVQCEKLKSENVAIIEDFCKSER